MYKKNSIKGSLIHSFFLFTKAHYFHSYAFFKEQDQRDNANNDDFHTLRWSVSTEYTECLAVAPLHVGPRGEPHLLAGKGVGWPNSDDRTETLVFYVYHRVYRLPGSLQVVWIGSPHPLTRKGVLLIPHLGPRGGDTLACGGWGGGTQFQRRDRLWYSIYTI